MQVLTGQDYLTNGGSGIGAVVFDKNTTTDDAVKDFFNYSNQLNIWKDRKEQRAKENYAKVQKDLEGLDFDTKGIRAVDADYFKNAKNSIADMSMKLLKEGQANPYGGKYLLQHTEAGKLTKAYGTMANASMTAQQHLNEQKKALEQLVQAGRDVDVKKTTANINNFAMLPLEQVTKLGSPNLIVMNEEPLTKILTDVYDAKKNPLAKPMEYVKDEGGKRIKGEKLSPEQSFNIMRNALTTNPKLGDKMYDMFISLPKVVQDYWGEVAQNREKNPYGANAFELYANSFGDDYIRNDIKDIEDTDAAKQARQFNYDIKKTTIGGNKELKGYEVPAQELVNIATGNYSEMGKDFANSIEQRLSNTPIATLGGGDNKIDVFATDFKTIKNADGTPTYSYVPSHIQDNGKWVENTAKKRVQTNDVVNLVAQKYINQFGQQGWAKILERANQIAKEGGGDLANMRNYKPKEGVVHRFNKGGQTEHKQETKKEKISW